MTTEGREEKNSAFNTMAQNCETIFSTTYSNNNKEVTANDARRGRSACVRTVFTDTVPDYDRIPAIARAR